jgi:hypothetical protein
VATAWRSDADRNVALGKSQRPRRRHGRYRKRTSGLINSPAFSSLLIVDTSPDVRATALACDDARTLKFTLIVQRMPRCVRSREGGFRESSGRAG